MKLQFLKGDSILPTTFYPPYMLNNLVNSETLNQKSNPVINMNDSPTYFSQINESDYEEDCVYMLNSDENPEKCSSLNYLSGINNSIKALQEIYQPSNRMEEKEYFLKPDLHFQTEETILNMSDLIKELKLRDENSDTDLSASIELQLGIKMESCSIREDIGDENHEETILNLSDLIKELKLRDENFDTDLSASIEHQLGIKVKCCSVLEDIDDENHENAFEDAISPSEEVLGLGKLISDYFDEVADTLQYNSRILNSSPLSLSDGNEEKKSLTPLEESHVNDPATNKETFISECYDEVVDTSPYESQILNTPYFSISFDIENNKHFNPFESYVNNPATNKETFICEYYDEVVDTSPYESEILNTSNLSLSGDIENKKILTPMESHVSDCITNFESILGKDIIADEILDINIDTSYTDKHMKTFDICVEQSLENNQTFPEHLENEIVSSNIKTNINLWKKNFCEIVEKPTNISMSQSPISKTCDEISLKPLPLAKFNFTQKNNFNFSKPASFVIDNIETFESKFDIFDSNALDLNNLHIFNQTKEKRLELIPYENDSISLSPPHSFTTKNDKSNGNTESNVEYLKERSDNEDKNEVFEDQVLSAESISSKPEKFSMAFGTNQQMCLYEKLHPDPKVERDPKINIESASDLRSDKAFVCNDDFEEVFSDDEDDDDDEEEENFFDSFDEIVFDTPLECIEKTELIFTKKPQESNCNETKEAKHDIVLFTDLPVIFKCVDEDTLEVKEVLLYPQERLRAILNTSDRKTMSREDAIKQLIEESKIYDGKTIGIIPNIKEPQFLQTEETDLPSSDPFESFLVDGNSDSNSQPEPQPKSNQEDENCDVVTGDVTTFFSTLFGQKESPPTLTADPQSSSSKSIKSHHSSSRAGHKEGLRRAKNEPARKSSSVPLFIAARRSPSESSVCIRYQRRQGIACRPSSSVPLVKTIKENVERHTKFGCEKFKRYSTYFFSPRGGGGRPQWGKPSHSLEFRDSTAQGNAKNKKVNIEEIATSDFKTHFQLYARRGRLKSGTVISKANSNYWLKKTGVVFDYRSERIAEECFANVARKKLVLNIFDYIKYLIAVSRKSGLALMDIVNRLKGITTLQNDLSRNASDSELKRQYGLNNLPTLCSSARTAFSRPLLIRSSRIPVSFPTAKHCRNFK